MESQQENRRVSIRIQKRRRRAEEGATEAETRNTRLPRPPPTPSASFEPTGSDVVNIEPGAQSDASSATLEATDNSPAPNAPTDRVTDVEQPTVCPSGDELRTAGAFLTTHGSGLLPLPPETLDETIIRLCDMVITNAEISPEERPQLRVLLNVLLQRRAGDDGDGLSFEVLDKVLECFGTFSDEEGRRDLAFYRYTIRWCMAAEREMEGLTHDERVRLWGLAAMCHRILELRRDG